MQRIDWRPWCCLLAACTADVHVIGEGEREGGRELDEQPSSCAPDDELPCDEPCLAHEEGISCGRTSVDGVSARATCTDGVWRCSAAAPYGGVPCDPANLPCDQSCAGLEGTQCGFWHDGTGSKATCSDGRWQCETFEAATGAPDAGQGTCVE